ncbi:hypothetical protein SDC9_91261 [bioreactor metagenome]|uniref:Uncharacterized protein n=1 Tax=bioreactor metagenome TaxID=1076179 RepID=A0A644ZUR1_9ZZZZ
MRIVFYTFFSLRNAELREHFDRAFHRLVLGAFLVRLNHLDDLIPNLIYRIQRRHGRLKDHGYITSAELTKTLAVASELQDVKLLAVF